jgi:hypothetical protein
MNIEYAAGQPFSTTTDPALVRKGVDAAYPSYLEGVLANAGVSDTAGARAAGLSRQAFAEYLTGDKRPTPGLLYVLPLAAKIPLVEDMLGKGFAVVRLPGEDTEDHNLGWFARSMREVVEAMSTSIEAASDHRFTRAEAVKVEVLCDRAISILLAIRTLARQAKREGVVGICEKKASSFAPRGIE